MTGTVLLAGGPFNLPDKALRNGPAPARATSNANVLARAGYDAEDQRVLRERGVA